VSCDYRICDYDRYHTFITYNITFYSSSISKIKKSKKLKINKKNKKICFISIVGSWFREKREKREDIRVTEQKSKYFKSSGNFKRIE